MSTFFFATYLVFIILLYLVTSKTKVLIFNALCCSFCAMYLFTIGGYAGVVACSAAAMGSIYQLLIYKKIRGEKRVKRAMLYKLVGSVAFTVIGIFAVYNAPSDILLIFAIASCRGIEMSDNHRYIKLGYMVAESLWFLYAANNGYIGIYIVSFSVVCLGLVSMYAGPYITKYLGLPLKKPKPRTSSLPEFG